MSILRPAFGPMIETGADEGSVHWAVDSAEPMSPLDRLDFEASLSQPEQDALDAYISQEADNWFGSFPLTSSGKPTPTATTTTTKPSSATPPATRPKPPSIPAPAPSKTAIAAAKDAVKAGITKAFTPAPGNPWPWVVGGLLAAGGVYYLAKKKKRSRR